MKKQIHYVRFTLTGEQFSKLLLLLGTIETKTSDNETITLNGAVDHQKMGLPGVEDKSNHFFTTFIGVDGQYHRSSATLQSLDGGVTYSGGASYSVDTKEEQ